MHIRLISSIFVLLAEAVARTQDSPRRFHYPTGTDVHAQDVTRLALIVGIALIINCLIIFAASIRHNSSGPCTYNSGTVPICQPPDSGSTWIPGNPACRLVPDALYRLRIIQDSDEFDVAIHVIDQSGNLVAVGRELVPCATRPGTIGGPTMSGVGSMTRP
jgi:hypothetical protein